MYFSLFNEVYIIYHSYLLIWSFVSSNRHLLVAFIFQMEIPSCCLSCILDFTLDFCNRTRNRTMDVASMLFHPFHLWGLLLHIHQILLSHLLTIYLRKYLNVCKQFYDFLIQCPVYVLAFLNVVFLCSTK